MTPADDTVAFAADIVAVGARSRARLDFDVAGEWRDAGNELVSPLSGTVGEAGTDRRVPVTGTASVRLGRAGAVGVGLHLQLQLRFGAGRIDAARDLELRVPVTDLAAPRRLAQDLLGHLGQVVAALASLGRVGLTGRLGGGELAEEDVEVSVDLNPLLALAARLAQRARPR